MPHDARSNLGKACEIAVYYLANATFIYEIDERRKQVWIFHIRHAALQDLDVDPLGK